MAPLLGLAAGAGEGLDTFLARMLAEHELEQRGIAQQETGRHNRATEDIQLKSLAENNLTRRSVAGAADADRDAARQDREGVALGKGLDELENNAIVSPETRSRALNLRAVPPERFKGYQPPSMGKSDPSQPVGQEEVGPSEGGFPIVGSAASKLAMSRVGDARAARESTDEYRNDMLKFREDTNALARAREGRLTDWGPPVITIGTPDAPGGATIVPRGRVGEGAPAPPTPTQRVSTSDIDAALKLADRLNTKFNPRFVGPAEGRYNELMQGVPVIEADREFAAFGGESNTLKNTIIKAITGAQMSEPEAQRIMGQIPVTTDKPDVWVEKMKATIQNLEDLSRAKGGNPGRSRESQDSGGLPTVGGTFQGGKVLSVTPVK